MGKLPAKVYSEKQRIFKKKPSFNISLPLRKEKKKHQRRCDKNLQKDAQTESSLIGLMNTFINNRPDETFHQPLSSPIQEIPNADVFNQGFVSPRVVFNDPICNYCWSCVHCDRLIGRSSEVCASFYEPDKFNM